MIRRTLLVAAVLAVAVVPALPASAGGFCSNPGEFGDRATSRVDMKDDCFTPTVARVEQGATLTFRNFDSHPHTVGGVSSTFGDAHKEIPAGGNIGFVFEEEGVFPYYCVIHPGMAGAVLVGDGEGAAFQDSAVAAIAEEPVPPAAGAAKAAPATDAGLPAPLIVVMALAGALLGIGTALVFRRRARARA